MKTITAFVWALLFIILAGIFVLGSEWALASIIHAPKFLEYGVEGVSVLGLLYLFVIVFKQALKAEKSGYQEL